MASLRPSSGADVLDVLSPPKVPSAQQNQAMELRRHTGQSSKARLRYVPDNRPRPRENTYKHQPIDFHHDIRVLSVLPGKPDDELECVLLPTALLNLDARSLTSSRAVRQYWALSYCWGEPDEVACNKITLHYKTPLRGETQDHEHGHGTFWIRDNLQAALVQLRLRDSEVDLWVDAICINQDNFEEKMVQVLRMQEIYARAENVCIWLGDVPEHQQDMPHDTFEVLRQMLDLYGLDMLVSEPALMARKWNLVIEMMSNKWFSRRWVLQELALSRLACIRWGAEEILYSDFAEAIAIFMDFYDHIERTSLHPAGYAMEVDARRLGATRIVQMTDTFLLKSKEGLIEERLFSLETLVTSQLLVFEATDPRDTIFAALALAKDSAVGLGTMNAIRLDPRIAPDYSKSTLDVYTDFMDYCIGTSQSLDIICRCWAPIPGESSSLGPLELPMPTWIASLAKSPFGFGQAYAGQGTRLHGDNFVDGPERKGQRPYSAGANLPAWHEFGCSNLIISRGDRLSQIFDGSLFVRGLCIGSVDKISERVWSSGVIPRDALELGGWKHSDVTEGVPDQLFRALVADRGPNGALAPSYYRRACQLSLQYTDESGDLNTNKSKNNSTFPSLAGRFLDRVQEVVLGRRFFKVEGYGDSRLGLGPSEVKEGDIICILFGCSVPVVLRRMMGDDAEETRFEFVGECYVHGVMDGQVISGLKEPPVWPYKDSTKFELR